MMARLVALTDSIRPTVRRVTHTAADDRKNEDQEEHERQGENKSCEQIGEVVTSPSDQQMRAVRQRIEGCPHQSAIRRG